MSTLAKARSYARGFPWFVFDMFTQYQEQDPDYIAALLTGYADAHDTPQTVDQYSKDVAAFLMWAAEPHLVARKCIGLQVMIFLIVFTGLLYVTKRRVWSAALNPHDLKSPRRGR